MLSKYRPWSCGMHYSQASSKSQVIAWFSVRNSLNLQNFYLYSSKDYFQPPESLFSLWKISLISTSSPLSKKLPVLHQWMMKMRGVSWTALIHLASMTNMTRETRNLHWDRHLLLCLLRLAINWQMPHPLKQENKSQERKKMSSYYRDLRESSFKKEIL